MTEEQPQRTLLLVDDETNILNALKRTLRCEGYRLLSAGSGAEGLDLLAGSEVGVIVSDQRMPQMTGVEFLRRVKSLYPKTVRIVLSGYTDLDSVTKAINEGAIYKFLTKPWEDEQLRDNIREAFQRYEMEQQNLRLTEELRRTNEELSRLNQGLEQQVTEKTREIVRHFRLIQISQEILEHMPVAVLGIDDLGMIAVSNRRANELFRCRPGEGLLGTIASDSLPEPMVKALAQTPVADSGGAVVLEDGTELHLWIRPMGGFSRAKGTIVVLSLRKEM